MENTLDIFEGPYPKFYHAASSNIYFRVDSEKRGRRLQLYNDSRDFHYCLESFDPSTLNDFGGKSYALPVTELKWDENVKWYYEWTMSQLEAMEPELEMK